MTKSKSSAMSDFVAPILVLLLICLVISTALAFTNDVTAPIIEETTRRLEEEARQEVLPDATGFELLDYSAEELPGTVTAAYKASNDIGYVFMITSNGYGGKDTLSMICSIDSTGHIVDTKVLSHSETAGLGSKVTEDDFDSQFPGKDSALSGVETISGATWSSTYYITAINDCFAAYDMVKEAA